jgi:hypothetical protein
MIARSGPPRHPFPALQAQSEHGADLASQQIRAALPQSAQPGKRPPDPFERAGIHRVHPMCPGSQAPIFPGLHTRPYPGAHLFTEPAQPPFCAQCGCPWCDRTPAAGQWPRSTLCRSFARPPIGCAILAQCRAALSHRGAPNGRRVDAPPDFFVAHSARLQCCRQCRNWSGLGVGQAGSCSSLVSWFRKRFPFFMMVVVERASPLLCSLWHPSYPLCQGSGSPRKTGKDRDTGEQRFPVPSLQEPKQPCFLFACSVTHEAQWVHSRSLPLC